MAPDPPRPEPQPTRRGFFRALLQRAAQPLTSAVDERLDAVRKATEPFRRLEQRSGPPPQPPILPHLPGPAPADTLPALRTVLRPPGALEEATFLDTCERCGKCVEVCPVQAIMPLRSTDLRLHKTPHIDPEKKACAVCETLACMEACPSGALLKTALFDLRMGLAEVDQTVCVRAKGPDCKICVEICPLGERAIVLDNGRVAVRDPGCIGCGLCQERCPTEPRAIRVRPV